MREASSLVSGAIGDVQDGWHQMSAELRGEQRAHQDRLESVERAVEGHARSRRLAEEQLQALLARDAQRGEVPPWFGQLESAVAGLERRLEEHRDGVEAQLTQQRTELRHVLGLRAEGLQDLRDELAERLERRLEQEIERFERRTSSAAVPPWGSAVGSDEASQSQKLLRSVTPRLDDLEARAAALKVRVDAHDARFGGLAERAETSCQQAGDLARQAVSEQREEILAEFDCQIRMVRSRVDALAEIVDEVALREVATRGGGSGGCRRGTAGGIPPLPRERLPRLESGDEE